MTLALIVAAIAALWCFGIALLKVGIVCVVAWCGYALLGPVGLALGAVFACWWVK